MWPDRRSRRAGGGGRRRATGTAAALLLVGALPAAALDPASRPHEYGRVTFREELPAAAVHALHQTADGYLWLGTYEGLVRFDGVEFEVHDRKNVPGLKSSAVICMAEDADGSLWFGTARGGLVHRKGGTVEVFRREEGLASDAVHGLFFDREGSLWIGTDRGISRLRGGRIETFGEAQGISHGIVSSFAQTPDGAIWAGGTPLRVFRSGAWKAADVPADAVASPVGALLTDRSGALWVGSLAGVARIGPSGVRKWVVGEGVAGGWVRALLQDRDGNVWVGTEGHGLFRLNGDRLDAFSTSVEERASDFVLSFEEDREGNLWVGTRGGLIRLRNGAFVALGAERGLSGELARSVFQDSRGRVWIGTDGGGLHLVEPDRVTPMNARYRITSRRIRTIGEDGQGALWVGSSGAGVFRIRPGGRTDQIGPRQGLRGDDVRSILGTRDGTLWVGTRDGLTAFRDGVALPPDAFSSATGGVNALLEARDGTLYAATARRGVVHRKGGATAAVTTKDGLAGDTVFAIHEDAAGTIWVGTADGVSRLKNGRVETLRSEETLFGEQVFSVLDDGAGALWMSNNKGVYRFALAGLERTADGERTTLARTDFGTADGMPSRQCNGTTFPAAFRTRDGRLWFPTANGVAIVDPARIPKGVPPPEVALRGAVVDGVNGPVSSPLVLRPGVRRLEISFAAPVFAAPERLSYRYRLVGFDDTWETSRRRSAEFTRLAPGTYVFEVVAATEEGLRSPAATSLEVVASPHFTQTKLFRGLAALALVLVVVGVPLLRVRRLAAQERRLQALVTEKTHELAEANARLEELSLTDPLTGIANRRQFDRRLAEEWKRCQRFGVPLAEVLFDVDHFKLYNDTFGHQAGDECLRQVAAVLAERLRRAGDVVARYGGEEFVALLPYTSLADAAVVAEEVLARVQALAIPHTASTTGPVVTLSAGVAAVVPGLGPADELTAAADAALYEAKRGGRNRAVASADTPADARRREPSRWSDSQA